MEQASGFLANIGFSFREEERRSFACFGTTEIKEDRMVRSGYDGGGRAVI